MLPHRETTCDSEIQPDAATMSPVVRWATGTASLTLFVLLAVSVMLSPEKRGRGTHQQLGLPPCTFLVLFGRPCPTCGMTTSWALFVRGRWWAALEANCGGLLLALAATLAAPWLALSAARGRWLGGPPSSATWARMLLVVLAVTLVQWAIRLALR